MQTEHDSQLDQVIDDMEFEAESDYDLGLDFDIGDWDNNN